MCGIVVGKPLLERGSSATWLEHARDTLYSIWLANQKFSLVTVSILSEVLVSVPLFVFPRVEQANTNQQHTTASITHTSTVMTSEVASLL
jgi:hypothetical protein